MHAAGLTAGQETRAERLAHAGATPWPETASVEAQEIVANSSNLAPDTDTIAAIATPPGRGGIGIVRVSGPAALALVLPLLGARGRPAQTRQPRLCRLFEPGTGRELDQALVTWFRAPNSFTGEDVVELAAHGSPVLLEHLLRLLLSAGARLARAGEFTERAFLSGRLDLAQAEAIRDLIDAQTLEGVQVAAQQLGGSLSRTVNPIKAELIGLIAALEAGIDFAEDDTPVLPGGEVAARIASVVEPLAAVERSFALGRLLREGIRLAIVGRPNVGKSSLFNRLLERSRAIVTNEPGTTRDTLEERLSLGGVPVELVDTAGLREAAGEAERLGIEKTREALAEAGLILVVLDANAPLHAEEERLLSAARGRRMVVACNKCDQAGLEGGGTSAGDPVSANTNGSTAPGADCRSEAQTPEGTSARSGAAQVVERLRTLVEAGVPTVWTSALTGAGIAELRAALSSLLTAPGSIAQETTVLTNLRQHTAVSAALAALRAAARAAENSLPHEMLLLDLYTGLAELDSLTGTTTPDEILQTIFSTFCIGK